MEETISPKKVLIVDDDRDLLDMYSLKFKENGFQVVEAFGSLDALSKLKAGFAPHILILDVVMPSMDGFELLSQIKADKLAEDAKIMMLSNLGQSTDVEKGRKLGAHGYVIKASATPSEVVEKALFVLAGGETFAEVD